MAEILSVVENADMRALGACHTPASALHVMAEPRQATDRSEYMSDPDFVKVPVELTSRPPKRSTTGSTRGCHPNSEDPVRVGAPEGGHGAPPTTRRGQNGAAVAVTYTINESWGTGLR